MSLPSVQLDFMAARNPTRFPPENQPDYQKRVDALVRREARTIAKLQTRKEVIAEFPRMLERLAQERREIARRHGTISAENFGQRRDGPSATFGAFTTTLHRGREYSDYNTRALERLCQGVADAKLSPEKKSGRVVDCEKEQTAFDVELIEGKELHELLTLTSNDVPDWFPYALLEKERTPQEHKELHDAMKKLRKSDPAAYKHIRVCQVMRTKVEEFPDAPYPRSWDF